MHIFLNTLLLVFVLMSVTFGVFDQRDGKPWWALAWYGVALWDAILFWNAVF